MMSELRRRRRSPSASPSAAATTADNDRVDTTSESVDINTCSAANTYHSGVDSSGAAGASGTENSHVADANAGAVFFWRSLLDLLAAAVRLSSGVGGNLAISALRAWNHAAAAIGWSGSETAPAGAKRSEQNVLNLPASQQARLCNLKEIWSEPYNVENEHHERELLLLWNAAFPGEALEARKSHQWKRLGFQGIDPATDFRGAGVLGLRNMLYLAEKYPDRFHRIIADNHAVEAYPVAITCFTISYYIKELLGWGFKPRNVGAAQRLAVASLLTETTGSFADGVGMGVEVGVGSDGRSEDDTAASQAYHELFVALLLEFDVVWRENGFTYMQFSTAMDKLDTRVNSWLGTIRSTRDLQRRHNAGTD